MTGRERSSGPYLDPPVLVCADLQTEYLMQGRRHALADAETSCDRCAEALALWRGGHCPVIHLKRIAQAAWFNPASKLTEWIAPLTPQPGEMSFEHPLPSAYSSARFADYMANMKSIRCVLLGFSLDETILSTAVEGYHRGHRYYVVPDAVACKRPARGDASAYKEAVLEVLSNYVTFLKFSEMATLGMPVQA